MPAPRWRTGAAEAERRRALELLVGRRDGGPPAPDGVSVEQVVGLIKAGLASAQRERVVARRPADGDHAR